MGHFDVRHVGVVEMHLDEDLELAPAHLLDLVGRTVYLCVGRGVPLMGFWKEVCRMKTTFLMR